MKPFELLAHLRSLGVRLEADGEEIVCRTRSEVLTGELRAGLRQHKAELLHILHRSQRKGRTPSIPRADRSQPLPLSFAQQRLWFLDQFDEAHTAAYNVPFALRLTGPLNHPALAWSLDEIRRRHEALRTRFINHQGQPFQCIEAPTPMPLEPIDLRPLPASARQAELDRIFDRETHRPFSLSEGPLVRVILVRLDEEEHVFLLVLHHIISDGWSLAVFEKELWTLYRAYRRGAASPLPILPVQQADYAQQQAELEGSVLDRAWAYWKEQLAGALPVLALPTDRPRPTHPSGAGSTHAFTLDAELTRRLRRLSQACRSTLFMTLLTGFKVLLHRYTGQEDILVGTPVANRKPVEIESLIGFFVNTLALRSDLSGDPSFAALLGRVRETVLEGHAHQDMPFEKLVEALQPERTRGPASLIQAMFVMETATVRQGVPSALAARRLRVNMRLSKFDVTLFMAEEDGCLAGRLEYSTDLFDAATIARMMGHFETLLRGIVATPDQPLSRLPLLTDAETRRLLIEWNQTETAYPRDQCVHALFEAQAARTPDAIALVFDDTSLSYTELNRWANQVAHYLRTLHVGPEVLVGVCMERSPEMIVALLGILKAGGAYVPIDPSYPEARRRFMLEDAGVSVLLTQARLRDDLTGLPIHAVCLDMAHDRITCAPTENPSARATADTLAYVMYTSGSTGRPKGVMIEHRGIVRLVNETDYVDLGPDDVFLQVAPISFDAATFEIWGALLNGARLVLFPARQPTLTALAHALKTYPITVLWLTSGLFHLMVEEQLEALRGLRYLLAGGDVLSVSHVQRALRGLPNSHLLNGYGPTEGTTFTCCHRMEPDSELTGPSVPIGRPIANTRVYLLDANRRPVPPGVPGELYIGGDGLARGYHQRPEWTAERFFPNPFSNDPASRLYKTGDLAKYLPDGTIAFLGRIDHQVKVRGHRIELGEIETVLSAHEDVRQSVVVVQEDTPGDKRLVAYVVTYPEAAVNTSVLHSHVRERLPVYMLPATIISLPALPLTAHGKIDRAALPAAKRDCQPTTGAFMAPRTTSEEMLAHIWSDLLGIEQVGIADNFFDLGGHSLLAIRMLARIQEAFEVELPLQAVFETPTLANLAQLAEGLSTIDKDIASVDEAEEAYTF